MSANRLQQGMDMTTNRREVIVGVAATAVASGAMVVPSSAENALVDFVEADINDPGTVFVRCAYSLQFRSPGREFSPGPSLPPGTYAVEICADDAWFAVRDDGSVIGDLAATAASLATLKERFPSAFGGADSGSLMFAAGIARAILSAA